MKILFLLLLPVICFAQKVHKTPKQDLDDPQVYNITKNGRGLTSSQFTKIKYKSYNVLLNELYHQKETELWDEQKLQSEIELLPSGGQLTLRIMRTTIESANTSWFSVVVRDINGNELHRERLKSSVAEFTAGVSGWWNIGIVRIPIEIQSGTEIFVIDHLDNKRFEYFLSL